MDPLAGGLLSNFGPFVSKPVEGPIPWRIFKPADKRDSEQGSELGRMVFS